MKTWDKRIRHRLSGWSAEGISLKLPVFCDIYEGGTMK